MPVENNIQVTSEIGTLRRIIIHSPDGGIGKIVPSKFKEWLYDDTVYLQRMRREYNEYIKLLLYFLDPEKIPYVLDCERRESESHLQIDCYKPDKRDYYKSDKVLDVQYLLAHLLEQPELRKEIVVAVCASEECSFQTQQQLLQVSNPHQLAKILISGVIILKNEREEDVNQFIFPPVPNLVFTRDIAIVLNDYILVSKAATPARSRESLLMRYITYFYLLQQQQQRILEVNERSDFFLLSEAEQKHRKVCIEGGDIMMIAHNHLLVGCSERTTSSGVNEIIHTVFQHPGTGIEKISVIKIPKGREQMHIDTVFTHVRKDTWVLYGKFSETLQPHNQVQFSYSYCLDDEPHRRQPAQKVEVIRFYKPVHEDYHPSRDYRQAIQFAGLEALLRNVSEEDFGVLPTAVNIIYSGNNIFPYDEREQWTDSCNVLALKDGVVVGYDRNEKTQQAFEEAGFTVVKTADLFEQLDNHLLKVENIKNTLILLPSAELSRARGGAHCMSLPLLRDSY
jgi:arginine deiminase